jgi:hypothetical protein
LAARIDSNAIADGFQLYLHTFVVTKAGEWAIVQQGMNAQNAMARRYHWHSATVRDFVVEPHSAIVGENQGTIMNLVDAAAKPAQAALLEVARERPEKNLEAIRTLHMPSHHEVRPRNVDLRRLGAVLATAYERDFHDFASLLLLEKLGPRTLQSLALLAEVVHGTPSRFSDPARFSFAHGGKDGHPFPVPLKTYDESIDVLRRALDRAKVGDAEKLDGFKRRNSFVHSIENAAEPQADFAEVVRHEKTISASLGGRTVLDSKRKPPPAGQLSLF